MSKHVVDAWIQHPTSRFLSHRMFESLRRWTGMADGSAELPLQVTVGAMEAANVTTALTCAWSSPTGFMISNDEVADAVDASGGRLVGVGSVDLADPVKAAAEVRRCAERGFKAIRVLPWMWELPPNHRLFYPVYAACVEAKLPFCLQIGHTGPLRTSEYGRPIPYLEDVLLDFPDLTVVGGHVGLPWTAEVLSLLHKFPNFYVDTSAYKLTRLPPDLVKYMQSRGGRTRVLFGSNWPMLSPEACLEGLPGLGLDDDATELFLHGNAERVFGLAPPSKL